MGCDPITIETGCRPVSIEIGTDETVISVRHKKTVTRVALILWAFGPVREQLLPGPVFEAHMTSMTDSQFVTGTVKPINKKGNPAAVQTGSAVWTSSDPAVLLVEQDATEELGVKVTGVASGAARCSCSFDADLGDGVTTVEIFEDFSISSGPAVGGSIVFGAPSEQP